MSELYQGRIDPPKAGRGHETPVQAVGIATEMLQVTKNRFQCAMRVHAMTRGELMKSADHYHDVATLAS